MKATCIVGSARSNGSTAYAVDTIIRGMRSLGAEAKKYCLGDLKIHYCLGCKKCYQDGICVQQDDVEQIVKDVLTSDVVVIAAPSYWADVPGQLKTYFDRNTPYGDTNPNRRWTASHPIQGVGIAIREGTSQRENTVILDFIDHYFGHLGITPCQRFSFCGVGTLEELKQKHQAALNELYELGQQLSKI